MKKTKLFGALLLVAIVFVSGCIGGSGSSTTPPSQTQSTSTPSTTPPKYHPPQFDPDAD
ncbi:hypothetical protein [Thermococcus sp. JCM 11816]|uniref:hypothetical protein n=1 Tax=Thermococcus sp. (strain JCM 11816 / KS-1) TaxID=1295125 RepID=UPI000AB32ABC